VRAEREAALSIEDARAAAAARKRFDAVGPPRPMATEQEDGEVDVTPHPVTKVKRAARSRKQSGKNIPVVEETGELEEEPVRKGKGKGKVSLRDSLVLLLILI
jgi:hypothetical protein